MNRAVLIVFLLISFFFVTFGETFPGRPMGDTLMRYFDDTLPAILIHTEYTDKTHFDTTEKIVPHFDKNNLVTDVFKYTKNNGDSLFVISKHAYFTYSQDGKIKSATTDARSSGKLFPYTQEIYSYQDTTNTVITKLSMIPGYPVENFIKKIYYNIDSNGIAGIRKYTYTKKTPSSGYWFESRRYVEYYNQKTLLIDSTMEYSLFTVDTLKNIYKINGNDTIITKHIENIDDSTKVNTGTDTTILNVNNKPIFKSTSRYNSILGVVVPYEHQYFTYLPQSAIFISSKYDTASKTHLYNTKEVHFNDKKNRRISIHYYTFDESSQDWQLTAKDTMIYNDTPILKIDYSNRIARLGLKLRFQKQLLNIEFEDPLFIRSVKLYNISGRMIVEKLVFGKKKKMSIKITGNINGILIVKIDGINNSIIQKVIRY